MTDVISLLHRSTEYPHLFEDITNGWWYRMSIQAGQGYASDPKIDGLHPYQYDSFEVAFYPKVPYTMYALRPWILQIKHEEVDDNIFGNVTPRELQKIYDMLFYINQCLDNIFTATH